MRIFPFLFLLLFSCREQPTTPVATPSVSTQIETVASNYSSSYKNIPNGVQLPLAAEEELWQLSLQYFEERNIIYLAINDYLWLDQAKTTKQTIFVLTQLATRNHALLGAKLQLNPQNGAITISSEIPVDDSISQSLLEKQTKQLIQIAAEEYPMLKHSLSIDLF